MATPSSIFAWRIPSTEEPSGLVHRVAESNMTEATQHSTFPSGGSSREAVSFFPASRDSPLPLAPGPFSPSLRLTPSDLVLLTVK